MKKLFTTFLACLAVTCMMAQGWPANYGGVMLQGFYWDSFDDEDWGTWSAIESHADDLEGYIDLIWVPNSARTKNDYCLEKSKTEGRGWLKDMGYMPCWWLNHDNTIFGNTKTLTSMINAYKAKGIGIIEDVVINHKNGQNDWCDFPDEEVVGTHGTYKLNWTLADICYNDNGGYTREQGNDITGAADTGDDFDGCRDLDHTGANVQQNVKTYLDFLQDELGYAGFRYDMVKGYGAQYIGIYNNYAKPTFSVGEYWDGYSATTSWVNGTKYNDVVQSAAFDFPLKFLINDAFKGSFNGSALETQGMAGDDFFKRYSVTFVDNHDTYRDGSCMSNASHALAANAFILAMPGTPCIFLPHWKTYKTPLKKMIAARKAAGVNNQSAFTRLDLEGGIGFQVTGTNGNSVLVTLGYVTGGVPDGYKVVVSGDAVNNDFCFYVNNDLELDLTGIPDEEEVIDNTIQKDIRVYLAQTDNIKDYSIHAWDAKDVSLTGDWDSEAEKISNRISGTACVNGKLWYYVDFKNQEEIGLLLYKKVGENEWAQTADIKGVTSDIFLSYEGGTGYDNQTSANAGYPEAWFEQGEICAFFVVPNGWNDHWYNIRAKVSDFDDNNERGDACVLIGYNESGDQIWKWTTTQTDQIDNIVFNSGSGDKTEKLTFVNGAWYSATSYAGSHNTEPISTAVTPSTEVSVVTSENAEYTTNWNGVLENVAQSATTASVSKDFTLAKGDWIVQAVVRGTSDGKVTLDVLDGENSLLASDLVSQVTLTGMENGDISTVEPNGTVIEQGTNNGWQKIEVTFTLAADKKVTVSLKGDAAATTWQIGALKVLPGTTNTKATTTVTETYVDATTGDYSFYERGANPNALIKAKAKTIPAQLPYNVIIGSSCENLQLTDGGYSFNNSGSAFTATNVSYDRTFGQSGSATTRQTAQYSTATVCLPFGLTAGEAEAAGTFWALDGYDSDTEEIRFVKVDEPQANVPYLFDPIEEQPFSSYTNKKVPHSTLEPVTIDGISFIGVNERMNIKSDDNYICFGYRHSDHAFVKIGKDKGANINPFRAYLKVPASKSAARINVLFDGENGGETGIRVVKPQVKPTSQQPIYNMSGQRVKTPAKKGIYIIGGKKFVIK